MHNYISNKTQSPSWVTRSIGRRYLHFLSAQPDTSLHCKTTDACACDACASRGLPVYTPAFTGTHYTYLWRDGQAELTWVAGHIPRWFTCPQTITHRGTNWTWHTVTLQVRVEFLLLISGLLNVYA